MKLIADAEIPGIQAFSNTCDEMVLVPHEAITAPILKDADILLVRTVTPVNENLLKKSRVRFVGTASAGTDHIDHAFLKSSGIVFAHAAGCNTVAVAEYVLSCLATLQKKNRLEKKIAGIIGFGKIGNLISRWLKQLGFKILYYDPFVLDQSDFCRVSLDTVLSESDFISIHTPLTVNGTYPTFHLLNAPLLKKIKSGAILINTARGAVIDESALLEKKEITLCLDVWENEPNINLNLLNQVAIGTPHIAGYSLEAKQRATNMLYHQAAIFFGWEKLNCAETKKTEKMFLKNPSWDEIALQSFDPLAYTESFRQCMQAARTQQEIKNAFLSARKNFPWRREW